MKTIILKVCTLILTFLAIFLAAQVWIVSESKYEQVGVMNGQQQIVMVYPAQRRIEFKEHPGFCGFVLDEKKGELHATLVTFWGRRGFTYSEWKVTEEHRRLWKKFFG